MTTMQERIDAVEAAAKSRLVGILKSAEYKDGKRNPDTDVILFGLRAATATLRTLQEDASE